MMNNYFIAKVRYARETGEGRLRNVTEQYLVEALMFGEVKQRAVEELKPFVFNGGEVDVRAIKREAFEELIVDNHDLKSRWFKCKISFVSIDEEMGREKKISQYYYVNADTVIEANKLLTDYLKGSTVDITIDSIVETKIMDVLRYE